MITVHYTPGPGRVYLSNELLDFRRDSFFFLASTVQVLDTKYLVYKQDSRDYLLFAPQIKVRNDPVFALGYDKNNPLRSFFITHSYELVNQGETYLNALGLPTFAVTSRNEGKSESRVWAAACLWKFWLSCHKTQC